jgi:condensin complex subunit 2
VDDTYSTSHRILESLSRNGTTGADEDAGEAGQDGDSGAEDNEGPRKKTSKTSTRLNIAQTIERNVAALNAVKLENDVAVDPMFHKISKAFDEGGAKGMLMNNLVRIILLSIAMC